MKKLFLFVLVVFLFSGCELQQHIPEGKIYYVGVALDYKNTNVNSLYGTLNDAKELEKAMRLNALKVNRNFQSFSLFQEGFSHSKATINDKYYPSVDNINSVLNEIATTSNDNDITIFYFSGHGEKTEGSILCGTTNTITGRTLIDLNIIDQNYLIKPIELKQKLSLIKGKKLIIIDSCHSGFFKEKSIYTIDKTTEEYSFSDCYKKLFDDCENSDKSIYLLCATESDNYSHEPSYLLYSHPHGYFTKALLEGLGWNYGTKGTVTHKTDPTIVDNKGVQGLLAEGVPPACGTSKTLSLDQLYKYIKWHQEIPLFDQDGISSYQHPGLTGERSNLILFTY